MAMKVEILTSTKRKYEHGRRRQYRYDRPDQPSRVFLEYGETVYQHLMNRRSRPWQQLKPVVADGMGVPVDKLRWSIHAGCGMCPCSGGFFIDGEDGTDYFVKVLDI